MNLRIVTAFLVLGWFLLVLQSTLFSYIGYAASPPELLLVLIANAAIYRREGEGLALTLAYGYLMDLFAMLPVGTYLSVYLILFILARLLSVRFLIHNRWVQGLLVVGFTVVSRLLIVALAGLTGARSGAFPDVAGLFLNFGVNLLGLLALFPVLVRLERRLTSRPPILKEF